MNIIVAFSAKHFVIGKDGKIPWDIPEDLARFQKLTHNGVVVMGRKTYESIPEDKRPLKNRFNIVVTSNPTMYKQTDNLVFVTFEELDSFLEHFKNVWIIGGESLYRKYVGVAESIYATVVDVDVGTEGTVFPTERFGEYFIDSYEVGGPRHKYFVYRKRCDTHPEHAYLNLMKNICESGTARDDRTGVGTKALFGQLVRYDISKGIPFLTTKFVAWKSVIKELLWFLRGETDSKILEAQGVNIWKGNTTREFLDARGLSHYKEGWLGPLYGHQWRFAGAEYKGADADYKGQGGFDQIAELIKNLKEDPYSRRHVITTFNPAVAAECVLWPCHGICVQFYVEEIKDQKYLSCHVTSRSQDTFLGTPFNIASYGVLTYILAKKTDMLPKELVMSSGDTHLYLNHMEQVKLQLSRSPLPWPILKVADSVRDKEIDDIVLEDFTVEGYLYHPAIKAPMAV